MPKSRSHSTQHKMSSTIAPVLEPKSSHWTVSPRTPLTHKQGSLLNSLWNSFSWCSSTSKVPVTEITILQHLQDVLSMNIHCSQLVVCLFETWKHHKSAQHSDKLKYVTSGIKANAKFNKTQMTSLHGKHQENWTPLEACITDTTKCKEEMK